MDIHIWGLLCNNCVHPLLSRLPELVISWAWDDYLLCLVLDHSSSSPWPGIYITYMFIHRRCYGSFCKSFCFFSLRNCARFIIVSAFCIRTKNSKITFFNFLNYILPKIQNYDKYFETIFNTKNRK